MRPCIIIIIIIIISFSHQPQGCGRYDGNFQQPYITHRNTYSHTLHTVIIHSHYTHKTSIQVIHNHTFQYYTDKSIGIYANASHQQLTQPVASKTSCFEEYINSSHTTTMPASRYTNAHVYNVCYLPKRLGGQCLLSLEYM